MRLLDKLCGVVLDLETPTCVLVEIGLSRSINVDEKRVVTDEGYRARLTSCIRKTTAVCVKYPYVEDDFPLIASYVNPDTSVEWDEDTLIDALEWMSKVAAEIDLVEDCTHGYPTPKSTRSVSTVYLYRYLISKGVRVRYNTTYTDLSTMCNQFKMSTSYLCLLAQSRLHSLTKAELISLYLSDRVDKREKDLTKVQELCLEGFSRDLVSTRYQPQTKEEAVAAAVHYYNIDISSFEDTLLAYFDLTIGQFPRGEYSRRLVATYEDAYDLKSHFNPYVPMSSYTSESLKELCVRDCLKKTNSDKANYHQLQVSHTIERFHLGVMIGCSLESIVYNTDIEEEDKSLFLSYGSYLTQWTVFTVSELESTFQTHKYFCNPIGGIFAGEALESLVNLANRMSRRTSFINEKARRSWSSLCKCILYLKSRENDIANYCKELREFYDAETDENKTRMMNVLERLLHIGLYSRGLRNLNDKWPIREVPRSDVDENERFVEVKLVELLEYIDLEKKCDQYIWRLPLLMVEAKTHDILINHDYTRGITIGDRLDIIKQGRGGPSSSCIMTSSGYLLATGYTYLTALGKTFTQDFSRIKIVL